MSYHKLALRVPNALHSTLVCDTANSELLCARLNLHILVEPVLKPVFKAHVLQVNVERLDR
jgi:hypothetical protein